MIGQSHFAGVNRLIEDRLRAVGTLIVAHRGTAIASVVENTAAAVLAAFASGSDVVEVDVTAAADGAFFAFHDGEEQRLLGITSNLTTMAAQHIRDLRYRHVERPGRPAPVEPLMGLLDSFRGSALFHLDRSWPWWPALLPALDELDMQQQLLLKSPADTGHVQVLRRHPTKYPYMPICRTLAQAHQHLEDPQVNTVGVELLAEDASSPFLNPEVIAGLRARGVFTLVNSEVLTTGRALFAGYDDELSVLIDPQAGWGPMLELGIDAIQTDWPWLLRDHRDQHWTRRHPGTPRTKRVSARGQN